MLCWMFSDSYEPREKAFTEFDPECGEKVDALIKEFHVVKTGKTDT